MSWRQVQPRPWCANGPNTTRAVAESSLCQYTQEKQDRASGVPRRCPAPPWGRAGLSRGEVLHVPSTVHSCWQAAISPSHNITHRTGQKAWLSHLFHPKFHQQWEQTWIYVPASLSYPACSRLCGIDGNKEHGCVSHWCNKPVRGAGTTFQLHQEQSSRLPGSAGSQGF